MNGQNDMVKTRELLKYITFQRNSCKTIEEELKYSKSKLLMQAAAAQNIVLSTLQTTNSNQRCRNVGKTMKITANYAVAGFQQNSNQQCPRLETLVIKLNGKRSFEKFFEKSETAPS